MLTRVKAAEQAGAARRSGGGEADCGVLAAKSIRALKQTGLRRLVVAGGVGANQLLRAKLDAALKPLKARPISRRCTCAPTTAR